ncbi:sigma-70 family RNA polymerase sigma factor [Actinophytocola sp.]|uniref:sigma-70 family RNA polymerase sigma factor n=1 Tax=Actinophytocola sp. TaxID=1872138 RepID=UPI003D6B762B
MSELAEHTDARLVAGVLSGDREAFAAIYDRYADRLHDFCHAVLRDRDEAADAVQDTFVLVAQRLAQLNDPERLRPWLYAVARSVALRKVRARRRVVLDEAEDMADTDPGPERAAEQVALRELVWSAAAGLSERDRALLDLHVRQGLDGAELGDAMGVSAGHAYVLLSRLRDQVERSLGALLIARQGREDCIELDTLLSGWDGRYSPLMRKRVARHVDSCVVCGDRRRVMVSPFALLAAVPLVSAPLWLRDRVMDQVTLASYESGPPDGEAAPEEAPADTAADLATEDGNADTDGDTDNDAEDDTATLSRDDGSDADDDSSKDSSKDSDEDAAATVPKRQRVRIVAAAAAVVALLVVAGALTYWRNAPLPGEPLGLNRPDTPTPPGTILEPITSATPSSTTSARPTTRRTTSTTAAPAANAPTTTTTTRPVVPPPDTPDPPDPPADGVAPAISGATAANPRIGTVDCPEPITSRVFATITDNVGVQSVTLSWAGAGSGSTAMTRNGDAWSGTVGTFTEPGSVEWTITATDAAGNESSTGNKIDVRDCASFEVRVEKS